MGWIDQYEQARRGAGVIRLDDWSVLKLTGPDRASFLQNFCTNDVKRLEPGDACEAFVTTVKGKVFAHILVIDAGEQLVVVSAGGPGEQLHDHFESYHIREDLVIETCPAVNCATLFGARAAEIIASVALTTETPPATDSYVPLPGGHAIRRKWFGDESWILQWEPSSSNDLLADLAAQGAVSCVCEVLEAIRIETGTPRFARDFGDENLPQEVNRNELAISFTKGCYLGQETVARIDALGHVNRLLCQVQAQNEFDASPPIDLEVDGKPAGRITSWTHSPATGTNIGLAMIRRGHEKPGTQLAAPGGIVTVV